MLGFLSAGHFVNDLSQGAIPALLPFWIVQHDLSYSAAAWIVFAFTGTSTIIQPLFGHLADRISKSWIIAASLILTGGGFALTGIAISYRLLIVAVIISGFGSAAFHPEAARFVNFAGGDKKATAMSIFGVGGTMGFALGPLLITAAVHVLELKGTLLMLIPSGIIAVIFLCQASRLTTLEYTGRDTKQQHKSSAGRDNWSAFVRLTLTIIGKSIIFYGLITFIPLYWVNVLNQSELAGGTALTVFSVSGVCGTLLGGRLVDRFGHVKIIVIACALLVPCLPALAWTNSVYLATCLLIPIGSLLLMTYGPTIVMGQKFLPNHIGLSSGMTLGVAFSVGGLVTPLLGYAADHYGISVVLISIAFIPVIITGISCTLIPAKSLPMNMISGNTKV